MDTGTTQRNTWFEMRIGNEALALERMRDNLAAKWNPRTKKPSGISYVMELGIGYLWLHQFEAALNLFVKFNSHFPNHVTSTYEMAGVAQWCLNDRDNAALTWRQGLHCDYADSAGLAVTPSLLLFFATVFEPSAIPRNDVDEILVAKASDSRSEELPFVQFVVGSIDELTLRYRCDKTIFDRTDPRFDQEVGLNHWLADFWKGVVEYDRGNDTHARELFSNVANLGWNDYDKCSDLFLSKLWSPEFFLARSVAEELFSVTE